MEYLRAGRKESDEGEMKTKLKRAKPFAANNSSRKLMIKEGWIVTVVEQTIPHAFIKRDAFGFGDLLCMKFGKGFMMVQSTGDTHGSGNFNARIAKLKLEPRASLWLSCGGRIQVHSWEGKKQKRTLRRVEYTVTGKIIPLV